MKKILFVFSLCLALSITVYGQNSDSDETAVPGASVESINLKDSQFENTVTIDEFNSIVNTLRGVYNFFRNNSVQIGINEPEPATSLTLDVGGKIGAEAFCDAEGENCIDPATWDERPQLELQPPAANCQIRYRVKDTKYQSPWRETSVDESIGGIARFNSGLEYNCSGEGCGVQMGIKCTPNLAVAESASCRLRYRINHLKERSLTPWTTTETTEDSVWMDGEWSAIAVEDGSWGDGLNLQASIECNDQALRCQLGYKLHNEVEKPDWKLSPFTQGPGWKEAENSLLSANVSRACDQRVGCGLQMQSQCVGTTSTLKTALYLCPRERDGNCPSLCEGQISTKEECTYQRQGSNNECNLLIAEDCEAIGHLVQ